MVLEDTEDLKRSVNAPAIVSPQRIKAHGARHVPRRCLGSIAEVDEEGDIPDKLESKRLV